MTSIGARKHIYSFCSIIFAGIVCCSLVWAVEPVVEVEETIVSIEPPNNGAGPTWCYGSPVIVRVGERVFVSVPETGKDVPLLCNTRWRLFERTESGWKVLHHAERYREREPCPLVYLSNGALYLSTNPSTEPPGVKYGPCEPQVLSFPLSTIQQPPTIERPRWVGKPNFTDHSYRGVACDGNANEILLFHIDAITSEQNWSFRDANGKWIENGKISFPIRACYPQVALHDRTAHIMAIGDIVEPVKEWQQYKYEKTERKWDYVFRRLFYTWTPDVTQQPFGQPIEIENLDSTAGHITNLDIWLDGDGTAYLLYIKQKVQNEFMRKRFFSDLKHSLARSLECVVVRRGKVVERQSYLYGGDGLESEGKKLPQPNYARFHATPDGSLYVVSCVTAFDENNRPTLQNRIRRIKPVSDESFTIPLKEPFRLFFTATERGGSKPSNILDLYGIGNSGNKMRYAQIKLK